MKERYDILEFISQREDGEMPCENEDLVHVANVIRRATESCRKDEEQPSTGYGYVVNEKEKREAERIAKEENQWVPIADISHSAYQDQVEVNLTHIYRKKDIYIRQTT